LIEAGALAASDDDGDERGVEPLASRLGISGRRLRQLFAEHVGASPLQVAHTHRAHLARRLIERSALPLAEVALAAGFASTRRMHAAVTATYRCAPRALRSTTREAALRLWLPARRPFDPAPLLAYFAGRSIAGVEALDDGDYRRSFRVESDVGVLQARPDDRGVQLTLSATSPRALVPVAARVQRMFDLDADAPAIAAELRSDRTVRGFVPPSGVRVPRGWDPFEVAVRALLGQQIAVAAARTIAGRIVAAFGEELPRALASPGLMHLFPTPARLARADLSGVGITGARAAAIRALAVAVDGGLDLGAVRSLDEALKVLERLPGFGDWTANYVALFALGEPDAFPAGDLGLRKALATGGRLPSEREVLARAERWRPWRGYAAEALWNRSKRETK
jgi:AraC family transcriptional regulator of adaptative response / DNA-3-methyladenine glycosylase II